MPERKERKEMPKLEAATQENGAHSGEESSEDDATIPTDAAGWLARGLKSAQLGFPDKATSDFEEAAWLDPENANIHFNLGTANLSMGMFEQALVNFDRTIEIEPDMTDAIGNRAVALTALGQDERAERDVARAVELGAPPDGLATIIEYVKTKRVDRKV